MLYLHDVGVMELLQEHDFSIGSLGIGGVLEGVKVFFQSKCFAIFFIYNFPDHPICPTAYFFNDFKPLADMRLYFLVLGHDNLLGGESY